MSGAAARRRKRRSMSISDSKTEETNHNAQQGSNHPVKEIPHYGTKICHMSRDSLFSSNSGFDDYRGFLNLCVILLAISNARLFLENVLKYGILVDPVQWIKAVIHNPYQWPNLLLISASSIFIFAAFQIELGVAKNKISKKTTVKLHSINLLLTILAPPVQILMLESNPIGSCIACGTYVNIFLKLWSYAQANSWYRDDYLKTAKKRLENSNNGTWKPRLMRTSSMPAQSFENIRDEALQVQYPYNLTYKNLAYFMLAPTLCYELNYPRTKKINRPFLLRRIVEVLFLLQLALALVQQWIVPTLQKAILPIHMLDGGKMLERLLRLSIPNHFIWLIFFYWMFHSVLNVIAELMYFADREFYRDWWNSETIVYFWQAWNIPVHKWCVRHVYKPLLRSGFSMNHAQLAVFLLSAFFHEYLVAIPLHVLRLWAFMGMVGQIPLAIFTSWMSRRYAGHYGNMIVWLSLIVGQPIAVLAYVYHYYVMHYGDMADNSV